MKAKKASQSLICDSRKLPNGCLCYLLGRTNHGDLFYILMSKSSFRLMIIKGFDDWLRSTIMGIHIRKSKCFGTVGRGMFQVFLCKPVTQLFLKFGLDPLAVSLSLSKQTSFYIQFKHTIGNDSCKTNGL